MRHWVIYVLVFAGTGLQGQRTNLLPDTIQLCAGDTASIEVRHEVSSHQRIRWSTPAGRVENRQNIKAFIQGKYYITVFSPSGATTNTDSSYVKVLKRPERVLRDTAFCAGGSVFLNARNPGMSFMWSTGERTRSIEVSEEGSYRVRISNGRCIVQDTARVRVIGSWPPFRREEISFCLNDGSRVLSVTAGQDSRVEWSTGAQTPSINVSKAGVYFVRITHPVCPEVRDTVRVVLKACECEMMIPNSFTPNEDGRNDYFFPVLACEYSYYNLTITDRWGNEVFVSYNPNGKWDGRYKGNLCPEDIYVFRIEATEKLTDKKTARKGHISLFR